jgi:hypothetical protein
MTLESKLAMLEIDLTKLKGRQRWTGVAFEQPRNHVFHSR